MLRYQAAIIAISCVPFFLIQYKKIHLSKTILFSIFFIIALSPLLIFNFLTFGTFIESEPSFFFLHFSEFENNTAWEKTLTERIESTGSTAFFEIDEFFIKNYFW